MTNTNTTERLPNLGAVYRIWQELDDAELLEDRREYDEDMLRKAYPILTKPMAYYLWHLIQRQFEPNVATLYRTHWRYMDAKYLAENITEALHQSLNGWSDGEMVIIELFLHDLGRAQHESEQRAGK